MEQFSALTQEGLGWYVYLLSDPRGGEVFYVGKGRGNRAFAHAADAEDVADHPELQSAKCRRILDIRSSGSDVVVHVLRHAISSEKQAYEVESAAIDLLNALNPGVLLNVVLGHHHAQHGLARADDLEITYAAPEAPRVEHPLLLVSLNRLWRPDMTPEELYESTHGWWRANGSRRDRVRFVLGVHNGVVRSAYRPTAWRARTQGDRDWQHDVGRAPRWGFDGEPAPEMQPFLRTSVRRFLTATQWSHLYVDPES